MSNEKMSADEVLAVLQDDMKAASVRRSDLYGLEGATEALHRSWAAHDAVAALIAERDAYKAAIRLAVATDRVPDSMREIIGRAQS